MAPAARRPPPCRLRAGVLVSAVRGRDERVGGSPWPSRSAQRAAVLAAARRRRPASDVRLSARDRPGSENSPPAPTGANRRRSSRAARIRSDSAAAPTPPAERPGSAGCARGPRGPTSPRAPLCGWRGRCSHRSRRPGGPPATAPGSAADRAPRAPARPDQKRKPHTGQAERHPGAQVGPQQEQEGLQVQSGHAFVHGPRVLGPGSAAINP